MIKKFYFFIFIVLSSCGVKEKVVDYESFLKQGKKVNLFKSINQNNNKINLINKINIRNYFKYSNWGEKNQNSQNLIGPINVPLDAKKKIITKKNSNLVIYDDKIFIIDTKANINVYDLNLNKISSKNIYKKKIYKNYKIQFSILAKKNKLFISDNLGNIHSFNIKDLQLLWKKSFGVPFRSDIKEYKNILYFLNSNSKIFSIDAKNGDLIWSFETSSKKIKDKNSYQIAIYRNKLFFTNDSSEVYCLDLDKNSIIWSLNFETENFQNAPAISISSPITIDENGILYVSNNNGYLYSIETNTGKINWAVPIYSPNKFILTKNYLFSVINDRFFVLNKKSGKILLNTQITNFAGKNIKFDLKDILINKEYIYLFCKTGYLIKIEKNNLKKYYIEKLNKNYLNYSVVLNTIFINSGSTITKY